MKNLAEILKKLREKQGLTQKELADKLNSSASRVSMYEQNRREPDLETIIKISNIFDCTIDYLLGNEKEKPVQMNRQYNLSPFEFDLLKAYWSKPEVREAVNKLLDLNDKVIIYTAASSKTGTPDGYVAMTPEEWQKLKEAPETDNPLV